MTQTGIVYGEALYSLCLEEKLTDAVLPQLQNLQQAFDSEPDYIRLLSNPAISKEERCQILDSGFRSKVHPYVLNFLKILTEKGNMQHFGDCCRAFRAQYDLDNGILRVTAVTAAPLSGPQTLRLKDKLAGLTGKTIELTNRVEPATLGGVRLDYDGRQVDGTIRHRLDTIRSLLQNTVL